MLSNMITTMDNLGYGLLVAFIVDLLLLIFLSAICKGREFNAMSIIISFLLLVPLTYQMARLIGACRVSETTSALSGLVGVFSEALGNHLYSFTSEEVGWFVFRRFLWNLFFLTMGGISIFCTMTNVQRGQLHLKNSSRNEHISSRRYYSRRLSRRK